MKSVGLRIQAFNWPLRRAKEAAGLSARELAGQASINYNRYLHFEALKHWPRPEEAERLAAVLAIEPDVLFPENLRPVTGIGPTRVEIAIEPEKVGALLGGGLDMNLEQMEIASDIRQAMDRAKLLPRERRLLAMRFGMNMTLDETALDFRVSRERIRQIEAKALRKMRNPAASLGLRAYMGDDSHIVVRHE